jgi:hypothetical protein
VSNTSNITGQTVIGRVDYWNKDKKFGFAYAGHERVFFHLSNRREVEGTPEDPVLTRRRSQEDFFWSPRHMRLNNSRIIMQIVSSPKGPKAQAWGVCPERTWLEKLVLEGWLSVFKDGEINLRYSRQPNGRTHREVIGRLTEPVGLKLNGPDSVTMTLQYDRYSNRYAEPDSHEEMILELSPDNVVQNPKSLPYGRYGLNVYVDVPCGAGEWLYIVFNHEWIWDKPDPLFDKMFGA